MKFEGEIQRGIYCEFFLVSFPNRARRQWAKGEWGEEGKVIEWQRQIIQRAPERERERALGRLDIRDQGSERERESWGRANEACNSRRGRIPQRDYFDAASSPDISLASIDKANLVTAQIPWVPFTLPKLVYTNRVYYLNDLRHRWPPCLPPHLPNFIQFHSNFQKLH